MRRGNQAILRGREKADAAVVGGGLSGLTIALWLARAGLRVCIVEADMMGSGTTAACAGKVSLLGGASYAALERKRGPAVVEAYVQTQKAALRTLREYAPGWRDVTANLAIPNAQQEMDTLRRYGVPMEGMGEIEVKDYWQRLLDEAARQGVQIREHSRIMSLDADTVYAKRGSVRAPYLVVATGFPILTNPGWYAAKIMQREMQGRDSTGQIISRMEAYSMDGLPFVGLYSPKTPNLFVASAYGGRGLIGSMMAAQGISARILGLPSSGYEIYASDRPMDWHMPYEIGKRYLKARLRHASAPRCPHMGCPLSYDAQARRWVCPCHGSRFDDIGRLLNGPALRDISIHGRK